MDARRARAQEKLDKLLQQATEAAAELQAAIQGDGVPHFDDIELPAHQVGQRLSCMIQTQRSREAATEQTTQAACPNCGLLCSVATKKRHAQSMDGTIELLEPVAKCRRCRRSFFPSEGGDGAG